MRFGRIPASVMALLFCLAVSAFLAVVTVAVVSLALVVTALVVLVISYTVEMEDGSAIGYSQTPELFATQQQRQDQPRSPEERAARRAKRGERPRILKVTNWIGAVLVTIGALGFFLVQL